MIFIYFLNLKPLLIDMKEKTVKKESYTQFFNFLYFLLLYRLCVFFVIFYIFKIL